MNIRSNELFSIMADKLHTSMVSVYTSDAFISLRNAVMQYSIEIVSPTTARKTYKIRNSNRSFYIVLFSLKFIYNHWTHQHQKPVNEVPNIRIFQTCRWYNDCLQQIINRYKTTCFLNWTIFVHQLSSNLERNGQDDFLVFILYDILTSVNQSQMTVSFLLNVYSCHAF
jgi:hypothetical protein